MPGKLEEEGMHLLSVPEFSTLSGSTRGNLISPMKEKSGNGSVCHSLPPALKYLTVWKIIETVCERPEWSQPLKIRLFSLCQKTRNLWLSISNSVPRSWIPQVHKICSLGKFAYTCSLCITHSVSGSQEEHQGAMQSFPGQWKSYLTYVHSHHTCFSKSAAHVPRLLQFQA